MRLSSHPFVYCLSLLLALVALASCQFDAAQPCFCKIGEAVEPCQCRQPNIDHLNNNLIHEKLQKLLKKDFFRFYKVNMDKSCPFWADDRQCGSRQCGIAFCDDEVPEGLRQPAIVTTVRVSQRDSAAVLRNNNHTTPPRTAETTLGGHGHSASVKGSSSASSGDDAAASCTGKEESNAFDPMDRSLEEAQRRQLRDMDSHDDMEDKFCEIDDEFSSEMHYVDLSKNPERYTGYKGDSAVRVWQSIYQENCFKPDMKFDKNFLMNPNNFGMCLEKRVFYRLISGLHSAITISIAAHNYREAPGGFGPGTWFRNTDMFAGRFGTKWSWEGPQRLRNLYFVYLLELRALLKAAPYLQKELFYTGNEKEDAETRQAVDEVLDVIRQFPDHFDEHDLFTGVESHARELREEFRSHFHNISRIMDCVSCDKCRLWGKVQTHGMGTALKILFSDLPHSHYRMDSNGVLNAAPFQLTRNEVVSLFQSFGRYSSSIREVHEFRKEMLPGPHDEL